MAEKIVVVTGANGFVASWIVKTLLDRGYKVRGTVRSPENMEKVGHLLSLPGAKERLSLHKAELLQEGAYDEVVDGADYVIHTATAIDEAGQSAIGKIYDPYNRVVVPSVEGTLNVLRSAAKASTVKRVVYTGSTAAVIHCQRFIDKAEDEIVDESYWSDPDFCLKHEWYYNAGKTLAEKAAFEFAEDASFDVVSILPCSCIGTILRKNTTVPWCNNLLQNLLKGIDWPEDRNAIIRYINGYVDVEDVAKAHLLAMETPSAEGRYLAVPYAMITEQMALFLAKHHPEYTSVLKPNMEGKDVETFMKPTFKFSGDKLRNLGITYTPMAETLKKAVESLEQMNAI